MCFHKKLAFDGCTQGDKCFLKCVFICSTSVWTSWIARFHYNNYRFRAVCDLNIPRSSLCSVVLTHVLLKLTQSTGWARWKRTDKSTVATAQCCHCPPKSQDPVARLSVTPRFVARQCPCLTHAWRAVLSRHSRSTVTQPLGSPCQ